MDPASGIPALERNHLARHDLDWLPPSYKAVRWTVAGSIWTALGGGLVALMVGTHSGGIYVAGKGIAALFAAGFYAGDRTARAVLKGRRRKLASGQVDLS